MKPWEKAIEQFLANWREREDVTGALVCGSYVTGNPSTRSDIDLHIILSETSDWRERGNQYIEGYLIEYFVNPPKQIRKYFFEDYNDRRTMAMVQFITGRVIFDLNGSIRRLKKEASEWKEKQFIALDDSTKEIKKYGLWDRFDNLLDCYENNRNDFNFVYHISLQQLFTDYCTLLNIEDIPYYQITSYLSDPLYLSKYLKSVFPDSKFGDIFMKAIQCNERSSMIGIYQELMNHVTQVTGRFEIDGWKVRTRIE